MDYVFIKSSDEYFEYIYSKYSPDDYIVAVIFVAESNNI